MDQKGFKVEIKEEVDLAPDADPLSSSESDPISETALVQDLTSTSQEGLQVKADPSTGNDRFTWSFRRGGRRQPSYFYDDYPFKINSTSRKNPRIKYMQCVGKTREGMKCKTKATMTLATSSAEEDVWDVQRTRHICLPIEGIASVPVFEELMRQLLITSPDSTIRDCHAVASRKYPLAARLRPFTESSARKYRQWRKQPYEPVAVRVAMSQFTSQQTMMSI